MCWFQELSIEGNFRAGKEPSSEADEVFAVLCLGRKRGLCLSLHAHIHSIILAAAHNR